MEGKKELDISQILVDYGVYNQSGINAMELDKKLRELFEQELDRAREETRQEERDMFIVRYATVSFNEVIKTIKTLSIIEFLSIKWGLKGKKKSKLTTK